MPELPKLNEILHSGSLAYGSYSKQFEDSLKTYFNSPYILATNSFSSAISVVLSSYNIIEGDEIIVPPMACLASTQPFASLGLKIVWADIIPEKGTLCPDSVTTKITSKTKAIIHNHFCGYPGLVDEINVIGKKYGILIIDDGIECFGSEYKERKIGDCGTDVTVFSFNPVRVPNTIDGGAIIFNDKEKYEKAILVRDCGIDRAVFRNNIGEIDEKCDIDLRGYSATMSNVNGYIGYEQMKIVDNLIAKQRINAAKWQERLKTTIYSPIMTNLGEPNYWVYGILVDNKLKAIEKFRNDGYYASGVHINNNIYSVFGDKKPLKGVTDFYEKFVALPCGWWMEEDDN